MADKQPPPANPFDPAAWRQGRDAYLDSWAKAMVDAVNTDEYAKATGAILDSYLTASSPFREALEKSMRQVLQQLRMPSSADFVTLEERLTNIEMRLDDMDAKLDRLVKRASPPPREPRQRAAGGARKKKRAS